MANINNRHPIARSENVYLDKKIKLFIRFE